MKILVVGSGGREHALVWKLSQSKRVDRLYTAPGNPGMKDLGEVVDIKTANIIELADFAQEEKIDLTVIGPEQPLALGIVDEFNNRNLRIFGPSQRATVIESSKSFAKEFMKKNNIPTANFRIFSSALNADEYLEKARYPLVIKADGLAGGKGVFICHHRDEAENSIREIMLEGKFGRSGEKVIIEDYLEGKEVSFMVVSDGKRTMPLVTSMDYKKAFDGDKGPNTGGMGAISPAPQMDKTLFDTIVKAIIHPTIEGLRFENKEFKGVLYAGLMITHEGPKVLEFNARFGDPETQVVMMRLKSDLLDIIEGVIDENLFDVSPEWSEDAAATVVLASKGYPHKYEKGKKIQGLERAKSLGLQIFHAGTEMKNNTLYTDGGRVLNVSAADATLKNALHKIYDGISFITFDNMYFRRDIGQVKK